MIRWRTRTSGVNALGTRSSHAVWRSISRLIPADGDVDKFVAAIGQELGRRIAVVGCPLPDDGPSALWVQTVDVDYILHADSITAEHRETVICHEVAHMVLGHEAREGLVDTTVFAPSIAPAVAARFLTREGYPDEIESDAEVLGTLLAAELIARADAGSRAAAQTQDNVSARLR